MVVDAIIFDKDGVLADSERLKGRAWQETLKPFGVENGLSWYLKHLGPTNVALAALAKETFSFEANPLDVAKTWQDNYRLIERSAEPIEPNLICLERLSRKYRIGVASSMDRGSILSEMKRFGSWQHISAFVSGEDVPKNKPAPDVYLAAARELNVNPSHCIAVEDSPTGVKAAKAAGMFCIGYKNPSYCLDLSQADVVTTDLANVEVLWQ